MRTTPMILKEGDISDHKLITEAVGTIREEADFKSITRKKAINITSLVCLMNNGIDAVSLVIAEDAQLMNVLLKGNQKWIGFDLMIV